MGRLVVLDLHRLGIAAILGKHKVMAGEQSTEHTEGQPYETRKQDEEVRIWSRQIWNPPRQRKTSSKKRTRAIDGHLRSANNADTMNCSTRHTGLLVSLLVFVNDSSVNVNPDECGPARSAGRPQNARHANIHLRCPVDPAQKQHHQRVRSPEQPVTAHLRATAGLLCYNRRILFPCVNV